MAYFPGATGIAAPGIVSCMRTPESPSPTGHRLRRGVRPKHKSESAMPDLTSAQRKYLRRLAHHIEPLVLIGKQGVTDNVIRSVADNIRVHELIKVKFNDFKDKKDELTEEIVRRTGAEIVGRVGHVLILYRENPEEDERRIELPV